MNADVREEFRKSQGSDPLELFQPGKQDATRLVAFLDYRAGLARRQQEEWIGQIETIRATKPDLDFVLTHVDDRFDPRMRDLIGADAARVLPLLDQHDFTFLIEDPATIWNLGPQRYPKIAAQYQPLTKQTGKLAIDINIVERYQDVYPTKQQTGTELFQLVHLAAQSFPRVALYFENSILPPDLPLLASAAASVDKVEQNGSRRRSTVARSGPGERPPVAGPQRRHAVASFRTRGDRTSQERTRAKNFRFQRRASLGHSFGGKSGVLLPKQRAGDGDHKHAADQIGNRRRGG
jgi:hypothetical protein